MYNFFPWGPWHPVLQGEAEAVPFGDAERVPTAR